MSILNIDIFTGIWGLSDRGLASYGAMWMVGWWVVVLVGGTGVDCGEGHGDFLGAVVLGFDVLTFGSELSLLG